MRVPSIAPLFSYLKKINYLKVSKELLFFIKFFLLVDVYLIFALLRAIVSVKPIRFITKPLRSPGKKIRDKIFSLFNTVEEGEIASLDLIKLAIRHLTAKKARTIITIGGMSIGFGSVIFLLSLGYGTQRLVISQVARLDEMKQTTVTVGQATSLPLNEETLKTFSEIEDVTATLPLVSVVSKVNYNNSISDMVAYGVSRAYLEESAIKPIRGHLFEDGEEVSFVDSSEQWGEVAGASIQLRTDAKMYKEVSQIRYGLYPLVWKAVYAEPSPNAEILGYTARVVGEQEASEVWGQHYDADSSVPVGVDIYGNEYSAWIKDTVPLWEAKNCNKEELGCIDGTHMILKDGTQQRLRMGFMKESDMSIDRYKIIPETKTTLQEGEVIDRVQFSIDAGTWSQIYSDVSAESKEFTLFTAQQKKTQLYSGELVFGESYPDEEGWGSVGVNQNGRSIGLWIRTKVPLWRKVDCTDCDNMYLIEADAQGNQVEALSVIRANTTAIEGMLEPPVFGQVLGDATSSGTLSTNALNDSANASSSAETEDYSNISLADGSVLLAQTLDDGTIDWVSISSGSAESNVEKRDIIPFPSTSKREAVVNQAMLRVLGVQEQDAIGETFEATLMLDQEFFDREEEYQAESEQVTFTIIGLIPGEKNPTYYVPFNDIKGLGVENYSQVKVVVANQDDLSSVRQSIESLGYKTTSVVDTVGKINSLFDTVRLLLTLLGLVALSVAALGMFNTLTVSLLEKTREVGLMKAIGMKSNEVKRLFFAESIVMGLCGGFFGIGLSYIAGYALSFVLSTLSFTKGLGYINLVYTPFYLIVGIMLVSFLVGVLTGLYPSHRATKISALNALRYE